MDKAEVSTLQQSSVAQITEQLPTLDREALIELAALEAAASAPRATLVKAIDAQLVALDDDDEDGPAPPPLPAKPAGKITVDDWRNEHYAGPLNGEQAQWRVRNIKPAAKVATK